MQTENQCKQCESSLPADSPEGACPRCLMELAMGGSSNPDGTLSSQTGSFSLAFEVPKAEQLIGKFPNLEIEHLVGRGGMGAVYKAEQTNLGRSVALKVLSPRLGDDPSFTERFAREARTLARLTHPNIVTVFDFGTTDSMHYLVMEFVDGVNLRDAIQIGRIQPDRALEIVQQICEALQYAHDSGIIHRDIKPENILIDRRGHVKIADFGLAKLLEPTPEEFTLTGTRQVMGTMNYMAPEQIEKPQTVDHRADLYSLGVVFYELLTGELPIGRFAPPSEKARCGSGLDEVVLRTLEKEPSRRFQQASQIKTAVKSLDHRPGVAVKNGSTASAPAAGTYAGNPVSPALPFAIGWGGCLGSGIARAFEDRIELEIDLNDRLIKSNLVKETIPIENVVSLEHRNGLFGKQIRLQTDSLDVVKNIPGTRRGAAILTFNRADYSKASAFVEQFNWQMESKPSTQSSFPKPPVKSSLATEEDIIMVDERMKVPRSGLLVCSAIQLIACFCFMGASVFHLNHWMTGVVVDRYHVDQTSYFAWMFFLWSFGSLATSLLLFFVARNIKQHLNYPFVIAGLIVCLVLPFSPATFAQVPFVVWAFVIMCLHKTRGVFQAETMDRRLRERAKKNELQKPSNGFAKMDWKFIGLAFAIFGVLAAVAFGVTLVVSYF